MEWTEKQILETLRLIEASDYDEVKLETENFKLHVRKRGAPAVDPEHAALASPPPPSGPQPIAPTASPSAPSSPSPATEKAAHADEAAPPGVIVIRSPMIGTFYRAPAPHAAPFVETGAGVDANDTVCLIEVMKLFNTIKAGIAGKVVKILAQNATTVKKDEALFWIEPSAM
ncbi:MAG: acetyl-CoA carboxylase biotin carboxyl carrier protein [Betaproteobacteria bacterium]|nr:MAG: acetyl-CoA carboxylase biotin carboxyl carrier protein [Betaproteobacteria bacterium]